MLKDCKYGGWKIYLVAVLLILSIWVLAGLYVRYDYHRQYAGINEENQSLAISFAELTARIINDLDVTLLYLKDTYEKEYVISPSIQYLFSRLQANPAINQYSLTDETGKIVASTRPMTNIVNISEQRYFTIHLQEDSRQLNINYPVIGLVSGNWSVHLSRRLNYPDGRFAGVIFAAVNPTYFDALVKEIYQGDDRLVLLVGEDGVIHAGPNAGPLQVGGKFNQETLFTRLASDKRGFFSETELGDAGRVGGFSAVQGLPLYAVVAQSRNAALADHDHRRSLVFGGAGGFTCMILYIFYYLERLYRKQFLTAQQLQAVVEKRVSVERKLRRLSITDPLTGVYNRSYFERKMSDLASDTDQTGIIIVDIDNLKLINDSLGHVKGDEIIQLTASILKTIVGEDEILARIGGDEFAILLTHGKPERLTEIYKGIGHRVEELNTQENMLSLSAGYVYAENTQKNITQLFKEADNALYRDKLHRGHGVRSKIVNTLKELLASRDYITEGHAERLTDLIVKLARSLELDELQIGDIKLLAQFHDIGKVGIPDSILNKPAALSDDEWLTMKTHAEIGYRIALAAPDLAHIATWILRHHERWDGAGYPFGVAAESIPIECRLLAIVDAYDAMTSDRPYRKALGTDAAIRELRAQAGSQFDARLVERFIDILEQDLRKPA